MIKIDSLHHLGGGRLVLVGFAVAVLGTLPVLAVYLADRLTRRNLIKRQ